MTGSMEHRARWWRNLCGLLLLPCLFHSVDANSAEIDETLLLVAVVASSDGPPYLQAIEGFKQYLKEVGVRVRFLERSLAGQAAPETVIQEVVEASPALILTLGTPATAGIIEASNGVPVVATLVLDQRLLESAPNVTGVTLEFPSRISLAWLKRLIPQNAVVGVLYDPTLNQTRINQAQETASELGLKLHAQPVVRPQELPKALHALSKRVDVLWAVPDKTVISPQTTEQLLLFSFRERIPFAGLSAAWVKAGALYALDRDYQDLGSQAGEIAVAITRGRHPSQISLSHPRTVVYSVNLKTAARLKIHLSDKLIEGAAKVVR